MSQTPIYEEVRRALGRPERWRTRRSYPDDEEGGETRSRRPVMLRGHGGRHRRTGD